MPDPTDPYDRASRYLMRRNPEALLAWLLSLAAQPHDFVAWLDTRRIPWPRQPERTCDTVAHLRDLARHGLPWAVVIEFQLKPDAEMFGRLLIYLGQVWLDLRPTPHAGDRFCVAAVVVNLTGKGACGLDLSWPEAGVRTVLQPREWNLSQAVAAQILDGVAAGTIPRPVLAWIPLMQGGDDPAIMQRWLQLAAQEPDDERRGDLGLAVIFAEAAGCADAWEKLLEGWNVVQSKVVQGWIDMGEAKGRVAAILEVLELRLGTPPTDLTDSVQQVTDPSHLRRLLALAMQAVSFEQFRKDAGL
jgi:hypothetical protein